MVSEMDMQGAVPAGTNEKGKEQPPIDPKLEKEAQAYVSGLSNMIHSKGTRNQVYEILKSGPPESSIPQASLLVNGQMEKAISAKGSKPSLDVLLVAGVYLVHEMVEIGDAGGFFKVNEEQLASITQDTMQQYITKGLEDGSIDPVELQKAVEPLMNEEQKTMGLEAGEAMGVPPKAGQSAAMEQYASGRVRDVENKMANKMAGKSAQAKDQGQLQGPQGR